MAAYLLIRRRCGYRGRDVAAQLNRDPAALSSGLTRFAVRLQKKPRLARAMERLATTIQI